jgi:hypothetical protein
MNRFKSFLAFTLILLALAFSSLASATTITTFTATISMPDPTQLGRLSRNGIPQDWSGGEAYPGVVNTGVTYHYNAYTLPNALFNIGAGLYDGFVQVEIDSVSANSFGAAYLDSYDPTNKATNWLGDAGTSGNFFGVDPLFYQIYLPLGHNLILVFNNTGGSNLGVGDSLGITVEGFVDNQFNETPEPSSLFLLGTGVVAVGSRLRKRLHS